MLRTARVYSAGTVPGPVSDLRLKQVDNGTVVIAVTGQVTPDGTLHNPEKTPKKHSTGRVYDSLFVRHWDTYRTPNRSVIWCGLLQRSLDLKRTTYHLSAPGLINALKETNLECPTPPFGGVHDYDIGTGGIIFVAKDPSLNQATTTKSDPYYLPLSYGKEGPFGKPQLISVHGLQGMSASPVFSPDGKQAAFLRMKDRAYESDRYRVVIVTDISDVKTAVEVLKGAQGQDMWHLSPQTIQWSVDGRLLFLTAEDKGRGKLFMMPSRLVEVASSIPIPLTTNGTVIDMLPLSDHDPRLLVSSASLIDDSIWSIIDPSSPGSSVIVSSHTRHGRLFGLHAKQVSEIWFEGAGDYRVHAWVMKPSNFDETKTYPLAYMIHGGPQGAWLDSWSNRWNPAVFAEQGYIVVAPNPTGSTGYGQNFVDAIQGEWGGRPYLDLVKGFHYIKDHMPFVDTNRAVALGASYGGYMINWIQGHDLGREFKALVTHDGVFSTLNLYATDELWFSKHDFCGTLWDNRAGYEQWDPARFTHHWQTPHLVIHNELDYRLPISEGLAAFNVLQERGVPSRFLTFPDENHWVLKPENSLQWHFEVLNWINRFVGLPRYQPPPIFGCF